MGLGGHGRAGRPHIPVIPSSAPVRAPSHRPATIEPVPVFAGSAHHEASEDDLSDDGERLHARDAARRHGLGWGTGGGRVLYQNAESGNASRFETVDTSNKEFLQGHWSSHKAKPGNNTVSIVKELLPPPCCNLTLLPLSLLPGLLPT